MSQDPEDVKPKMNLAIKFLEQVITVKVRKNMQMEKLFSAAEKTFQKAPGTLRFRFEDTRLRPESTPADFDMEDGDQIDAFLAQVGG